MANLETKLINKLQTSKPNLYLRYVDDIFAIFDNQEACSPFFRQLNPNIQILNLPYSKAPLHSYFWMSKLRLLTVSFRI